MVLRIVMVMIIIVVRVVVVIMVIMVVIAIRTDRTNMITRQTGQKSQRGLMLMRVRCREKNTLICKDLVANFAECIFTDLPFFNLMRWRNQKISVTIVLI